MSDEVSQFLEQVERLRDQQVEEDEVRARELEEYLAAKRERQARREERARSISPQKSSPANTPSPRSAQRTINHSDATRLESPTTTRGELRARSSEPEDTEAMTTDLSPSKENHPPLEGESKYGSPSATQSRSSPLSWQRRPTSRGGSRPLSMVAAQNATQRSLIGSQEPPSATEDTVSRDQIARALGAKDPTWFRQTADRGVGSAAYRRNQVEDDDRSDMSSTRAQLPGMSQERVRQGSIDSANPSTYGRLASPARLDPPQLSPQLSDSSHDHQPTEASLSSPPGRTSPTRSTSPTKGMGGFVQSAMMKRSDSVKRWSVVSPTGLTRADSVARPSHERNSSQLGLTPQKTGPGRFPDTNNSRPTSRHGDDEQQSHFGASEGQPADQPASSAVATIDDDDALPVSPSKTMDQRRWSPTKSSWLESALSKKETPKTQPNQATPSQPAWRMELKNQASKSGASTPDTAASGAYSHRHQVSIGGLMRSSPMGTTSKTNMTGLGGIYSPPTGGTRPLYGHGSSGSISRSLAKPESPGSAPLEEIAQVGLTSEPERLEPQKPTLGLAAGTTKTKPATPPKKDFRSNLKQRSSEPTTSKTAEPEFKNVFGTLRKTKTQNYVAPDELKSNIMRGKAALAVTGGPQKSERKDEFKEAILKKKEDFKKAQVEGLGVKPNSSSSTEKPIPEGLARRATLGKASAPKPLQIAKAASPKPVPGPKRIASNGTSVPGTSSSGASGPSAQPAQDAEPEQGAKAPSGPRALPNPPRDTSSGSPRPLGKVGGGKLADRFNPALASMLARGPPGMSSGGGSPGEETNPQARSSAPDSSSEPSTPGPQLTHMTKGRARGPKRKAPSSVAAPATSGKSSTNSQSREQPPREVSATMESVQQVRAEEQEKMPRETSAISEQVATKATIRSLPIRTTESAMDTKPAPLRRLPSSPGKAVADLPSPLKPHKTGDASSQPGSPRKLDMKRMSRFLDGSASDKAAEPAREPIKLTHQRTGSRSPTKFSRPIQAVEPTEPTVPSIVATPSKPLDLAQSKPALKSPPIKPKPSFDKLVRAEGSPKPQTPASSRPLPVPPPDSALVPSPLNSPTRQGSDVGALLDGFFGPDRPVIELKVDPAELLMNHPGSVDKVQTTGFQVVQVSSDGKKAPVASHNERVLFDQEMYICYHEFMAANGRQLAEVFFWVGDEVPEPIADDASLFAQKEARSIGGKLVKIRQGKETAQFLQAIGGVVIIRRGSSSKYDSLAPSMLCGRRCLGQVAFDEVDLATTSLCSGFPYLITHSGKCYLWKGKGSDVDELGCARLVGMELSMTGELIELDEGSEADDFWSIFDGGSKPHSADHWRLKPNYNKYCCRLFCSDAESRQQIFEISPFAQSDLSPLSIYIVDAFFEMYIVVGSRAQSQYSSFRNALNFAQDYAIVAASMEDRPFVPVSTVVLEGIPRDLKRVFRNWSDSRSPTAMPNGSVSTGPGLKRVRSLRVVPLTQALRAVNE